jgi:hypothetical protein
MPDLTGRALLGPAKIRIDWRTAGLTASPSAPQQQGSVRAPSWLWKQLAQMQASLQQQASVLPVFSLLLAFSRRLFLPLAWLQQTWLPVSRRPAWQLILQQRVSRRLWQRV